MQSSARPFESLDWYREARRRDYRANSVWRKMLRWLRSSRCFAFHVGLFALGVTVALAFNVARNPGDLWVDTLATGWVLLLVVHVAIIAIIFAVSLLGTSEQRLPNYVPQRAAEPAGDPPRPAAPAWPAPPATTTAPDAPLQPPVTPPAQIQTTPATSAAAPSESTPAAAAGYRWDDTRAQSPSAAPESSWPVIERPRSAGSGTASWREASPAAWLRRPRGVTKNGETGPRESSGAKRD